MESLKVQVGNRWFTVEITDINCEWIKTKVDGDIIEINITELGKPDPALQEQAKNKPAPISKAVDPKPEVKTTVDAASGETKELKSPMPGTIVAMSVEVGQTVQEGDEICMLETMKMEQSIRFNTSGTIKKLLDKPSESVQTSSPLLELE